MNIEPDKYTVTAAIHSSEVHSEKCYHWVDNACPFEVAGLVYLPTKVNVRELQSF